MDIKVYRISGIIEKIRILHRPRKKEGVVTKRRVIYRFVKEITAYNEKHALEKIYSIFGGIYKVKRKRIKILEIKELKPEEILDKKIKKLVEYGKRE